MKIKVWMSGVLSTNLAQFISQEERKKVESSPQYMKTQLSIHVFV